MRLVNPMYLRPQNRPQTITLRLIRADCRLPQKRSVVSRHLNIDRRLGSLHGLGASQDTGTGEAGEQNSAVMQAKHAPQCNQQRNRGGERVYEMGEFGREAEPVEDEYGQGLAGKALAVGVATAGL